MVWAVAARLESVAHCCGKVSNSGSFFSLLKGLEKAGMLDR